MTDEQARAFEQLRGLAKPHRYRVVADAEGFPVIACRSGAIEWYHEEGVLLAAFTARRLMRGRLLALSGIIRHQIGDEEIRVLFPADRLPAAARLLGARRRRTLSPEVARKLGAGTAYRASLGPQVPPSPGNRGRWQGRPLRARGAAR